MLSIDLQEIGKGHTCADAGNDDRQLQNLQRNTKQSANLNILGPENVKQIVKRGLGVEVGSMYLENTESLPSTPLSTSTGSPIVRET